MNPLRDANCIYDGGTKAIASSSFKQATQQFQMNQLLETAILQKSIAEGTFKPNKGRKFLLNERGKLRYITSNTIQDKTIKNVLCDEIIMPAIQRYLIYDNGASQKGKGTSFTRARLEKHLHEYYRKNRTNEGYIALIDFSGYYANILHDRCKEVMCDMLRGIDANIATSTKRLMDEILRSYALDVSYLSDEKVAELYSGKVDPMLNKDVDVGLLTGTKMLAKGVDIGERFAQCIGLAYAYKIDNYIEIVRGCGLHARYSDDSYIIASSKHYLEDILNGVRKVANEYGIIINEDKTKIVKISSPFVFLQVKYCLTKTGKVTKRINSRCVARERKRLKMYAKYLKDGVMQYGEIENNFKSWLCGNWQLMSSKQIYELNVLYKQLFGKEIKWKKKGRARLRWLMEHSL